MGTTVVGFSFELLVSKSDSAMGSTLYLSSLAGLPIYRLWVTAVQM